MTKAKTKTIRSTVQMFHPNDFTFDPLRNLDGIEEMESFKELVSSLVGRNEAQLQPIREPCSYWVNDDGQKVLFAGHRRVLAAKIAEVDVPAYEIPRPGEFERYAGKLISNMQREDLNPVDEAKAFADMINEIEGMSGVKIARIVGKSEGWVSQRLALLDLAEPIKAAVQEGKLSAKAGYAASRIPEEDQRTYADSIIASKTVDGVKTRAASLRKMHELDQPVQQQIDTEAPEMSVEPVPDEDLFKCLMLLKEANNLIKQAIQIADDRGLEICDEMSKTKDLVLDFFKDDEEEPTT